MLLEINELYGGYGHGDIVKGVTFHADQGEILCLIGPNGCLLYTSDAADD